MLRELICKCFIGFGSLSTGRMCQFGVYEAEIPVELLKKL